MPARTRALSLVLRSAVYAAALAALLLAPDPSDSLARSDTVTFRSADPAASRPDRPSPVRVGLAILLLAGAALEARGGRQPWR